MVIQHVVYFSNAMVGKVNGFFGSVGKFCWVLVIHLDLRFLDSMWLIFSLFCFSSLMKYSIGLVYLGSIL